jgi:hypothetical protein
LEKKKILWEMRGKTEVGLMEESRLYGKIVYEQAPSVKLIKGQKDSYGWEIKVYGKNMDAVLKQVNEVNEKLLAQYSKNGEKE